MGDYDAVAKDRAAARAADEIAIAKAVARVVAVARQVDELQKERTHHASSTR